MRDKIGSVAELFTVIEMSGHSHRSSVGGYSSAEYILRGVVNACQTEKSVHALSEGECETCCTIIGP